MSRVQLAVNVSDVDEAVAFYTKLFGVGPAKRRNGYANFAIAEPPLKLVLIEGGGAPGSLNHLGVEVEDASKVRDAISKFVDADLDTDVEEGVTCCYAVQDKVWVTGPGRERWEVYTVLADARPDLEGQTNGTVDCDQTACSCQAHDQAAEQGDSLRLEVVINAGCC